jgi:hypothetical protein
VGHLGEEFRSNDRKSPFHEHEFPYTLTAELKNLFKSWHNEDPPPERCAAIVAEHLRFIHDWAIKTDNNFKLHQFHLLAGAFFFGLRPGEHSYVPDRGKTKLLCVEDFAFLDKNKYPIPLETITPDSKAEFVSFTIRNQKNGVKQDTRTHRKTTDPLLCPVRHWAHVVHHIIRNSPKGKKEAINFFAQKNASDTKTVVYHITSQDHTKLLRETCTISPKSFGYQPHEISARSIRAGMAMALFLGKCSGEEIRLLGRWRSMAYLDYIRPKMTESFSDASNKMTTNHLSSTTDIPTTHNERYASFH